MKPKYPKSTKEAKKGGAVLLQFIIDENGFPKDIVALTSLGFGLEVAMKADKPIRMEVQTPYNFTPPGNVDSP